MKLLSALATLLAVMSATWTTSPAAQPAEQRAAPQRSQRTANGPDARNTNPEGEGLAKSAPARIGKADRSFVTKAAAGNLFEIEVSKLAASRAADPRIKSLAQVLIRDHTKILQGLQEVALNHNYPLPDQMADDQRAIVERLATMSGKDFDGSYQRQVGVRDHEQDIKLFESASRATRTADLKAWIDQTLPTLRDHLKHALEIKPE